MTHLNTDFIIDLLIASIALTHREPLLTKNAKHFSLVPSAGGGGLLRFSLF